MDYQITDLVKKLVFVLGLILILWAPCRLKAQQDDKNPFLEALDEAEKNISEGNVSKAKAILMTAADKKGDKAKTAPYVDNGTLVFYVSSQSQSVAAMMRAAVYGIRRQKLDSGLTVDSSSPLELKLDTLWAQSPWEKSITVHDPFSLIYFYLGALNNEEQHYERAIAYLDTAVRIHPGYGIAWAEMVYAYASMRNFDKAKEVALSALKLPEMEFDIAGKASIYRKLGWMAVEEMDMDKGEEYYNESLKLEDSEIAHKELEDLKKYREYRKMQN